MNLFSSFKQRHNVVAVQISLKEEFSVKIFLMVFFFLQRFFFLYRYCHIFCKQKFSRKITIFPISECQFIQLDVGRVCLNLSFDYPQAARKTKFLDNPTKEKAKLCKDLV